ncbi:unnamed protein product [Acanthoscelides obtectus]|uniref:Glucuronosyltransferase n=1 Tax=Acanthoscelides obtectus TaxID=200917 RepID=A0A9P0L423_ACAOB|nr:unnamed protein product [Acanthoscelides obtectus]CAK1668676.1 Putative UDP-glucuronosyltransferase ugt-60 [Acanthoscelides obtectus]
MNIYMNAFWRDDIPTGHPNVKAFIFQGGISSLAEAAYCGIPSIVIPFYADQLTNALIAESKAGGVVLQIDDINVKNFRNAIKEVFSPK